MYVCNNPERNLPDMIVKKSCFLILFLAMFSNAFATQDTDKVRYVHSYISLNAGYCKNIYPQLEWIIKGVAEASISGYFALKETYFGISLVGGCSEYSFVGRDYEVLSGKITEFSQGESSGLIKEAYLLGGLGFKIPEHTTRYAIEVRVMIGGSYGAVPATTTLMSTQTPNSSYSNIIQTVSSQAIYYGSLDAGIGYGYKISQRWGLMANCDWMFIPFYKPTGIRITNLDLSAGLVYTFGKMIGNFVY